MSGCYKDAEYIKPVDVAMTTALIPDNKKMKVGDIAIFRDCSQGALSHEWIIDEKASFISDLKDTTSVFGGSTTNNSDAYVLLKKSGITTIKLRNVYDRPVTTNEKVPVSAVQEGDFWVLEKVYEIEAFGELKPGFEVFRKLPDGTEESVLKVAGNDNTTQMKPVEINLVQGDMLRFAYDWDSEYKADNVNWTVPQGVIEGDPNSNIYRFNNVTEAGKPITGFSVTVTRNQISDVVPSVTTKKTVPIVVNVERGPLVIVGTPYQAANGNIILTFNKNILLPIDENVKNAFKFNVNSIDGSTEVINVTEVKANVNKLEFVVSDFEKYEKQISMSFDGSASIFAIDDISKEKPFELTGSILFSPFSIMNSDYFSFTLPATTQTGDLFIAEGWWASCSLKQPAANGSYVTVMEEYEGQKYVLKYDLKTETKDLNIVFNKTMQSDVKLEAGTYTFKCKYYVEHLGSNGNIRVDLWKGTENNYTNGVCNIQIDESGKGGWKVASSEFTLSADHKLSGLRLCIPASSWPANSVIYLDDLYLEKKK